MSTPNITPAPWRMEKCGCGHPSCNRYGVSSGLFYQGCGFDEADARLVAAAPELLAALSALVAFHEPDSVADQKTDAQLRAAAAAAWHLAEAAIAKAVQS